MKPEVEHQGRAAKRSIEVKHHVNGISARDMSVISSHISHCQLRGAAGRTIDDG